MTGGYFFEMKDKKMIRYLLVKDENASVEYTDDFVKMMKHEFNYFFDTTDQLFDRYPDIRVFVKDESLFSEKPAVYYYQDNELITAFNGTMFFAKLGTHCIRSLSKKEAAFLLKNLKKDEDGTYRISYES